MHVKPKQRMRNSSALTVEKERGGGREGKGFESAEYYNTKHEMFQNDFSCVRCFFAKH
jgi:hypothetical protein